MTTRTSFISNVPPVSILFFSGAVGYISLSQEILWMRLISYATGSAPEVFANVLGFFLLGIAGGSLLGRRACDRPGARLLAFVALLLLASAVTYYAAVPLIGWAREANFHHGMPDLPHGLAASFGLVFLIAFLQGGILTILCHVGVKREQAVGASVSWIYVANIVGSTLGPLLTGFVLLDVLTVQQNIVLVSVATVLLSGIVATASELAARRKAQAWAAVLVVAAGFVLLQGPVFYRLLEKLQGFADATYLYALQNRSGIIAVMSEADGKDTVFGAGMYDGRFNIDPDTNTNGVDRAYLIAAMHRQPTRMLMIGLATGSWARVVSDYELTRELTVVEIDPGYIELIRRYPEQAAILENPKVKVVIDDGRRWLLRNPEARFDFILMNTTYHWRSQASNLLSADFLRLAKRHLNPGGVIFYNSTSAPSVPYTAARVFEHVVQYANFIMASDHPFDLTAEERAQNLDRFVRHGTKVFNEVGPGSVMRAQLIKAPLNDVGPGYRAQERPHLLITDDNMATEYKAFATRPVGIATLWDLAPDAPWLDTERTWFATLSRTYGTAAPEARADLGN